jgi:hypothetical protein
MSDDFHSLRRSRAAERRLRRAQRRRRAVALVVLVAVLAAAVVALVLLRTGPDAGSAAAPPGSPTPRAASATDGAEDRTGATPVPTAEAVTATTSGDTAEAASSPAPRPSPTAPPLREPTEADPLRVYFGGDSLAGMPGVFFAQRAAQTDLMSVRTDYQVSSRLALPEPVDWPARLRAQMSADRYDVGVFMIGINDPGMPMIVGGRSTGYPSEAWLEEYGVRVADLARIMLRAGVERVYLVGLPPMPTQARMEQVRDLNTVFRDVAAGREDVAYVDAYSPLATKSGAFDASLRSSDGIHFTNEGATRIADAVWETMESDWLTPHAVVPQGILRWRP